LSLAFIPSIASKILFVKGYSKKTLKNFSFQAFSRRETDLKKFYSSPFALIIEAIKPKTPYII